MTIINIKISNQHTRDRPAISKAVKGLAETMIAIAFGQPPLQYMGNQMV